MGNIVLLDDLTINKIAAGEVIERPASVVKEMVENSIDAGSKNILVEIKNGGISFIKITDDGCGISEDDMEIAFERHATSKIRTADDLTTVTTMGFRGEALASIAAISNVEMISKKEGEEIGHKIVVEGGKVLEKSEIGCPVGTTITVRNLFFNTPVRYKFLKKDYTEAGYIEENMKRIALVNKEISIKLINSGKIVLQTNGSGDFKNIIYSIYGKDIANGIVGVDYTYEDIKVTGVVGKPEIARSNRQNQLFFVNGRYIKDKNLTIGTDQAYKGMIPTGKFGFVILNLEMNPSKLDVNVHPAKLEVRFQDENAVFKAVYHAIKASVGKDDLNEKIENPMNIKPKSEVIEEKKENAGTEVPQLEIREGMTIEERVNAINSLIHQISPERTMRTVEKNVEKRVEPENKLKDLFVSGKLAKDFDNDEKDYDEIGKTIQFGNTKISSNTQEINTIDVNQRLKELTNRKLADEEKIEDVPEKNEEVKNITNEIVPVIEKKEEIKIEAKEEIIDKGADESTPVSLDMPLEQPVEKDKFVKEVANQLLEAKMKQEDSTEIIDTSKVKEVIKDIPEITPEFEMMYKKAFGVDLASNRREDNKEEVKESPIQSVEENDISYMKSAANESLFETIEEYESINYKLIGEAFSTYVIIEIKDNLYMINKQLACERIIYEELRRNYDKEEDKDSQLLLLPDVITLTSKQMNLARENKEMFRMAGFDFEEFGDNTIKLSSVPSVCEDLNTKELFLEVIDELDTVAVTDVREKEDKFVGAVASKTAEKINLKLDMSEMDSLVQTLLKLPEPFINSNGKSVAIKMTKYDLERKFSRK